MAVELRAAIPQFTVPDVVRTAERYRDQLGFEIVGYWREPPVFAIVRRGDVQIFLNRGAPGTIPRSGRADGAYDLYLEVEGVDQLAAELRARGAKILEGPVDREYGRRELVVDGGDGLVIAAGEPLEPHPEEEAR